MDETYFLDSQKGQKDIENRKSRKRGGSSTKRGKSGEQICVLVARDQNKTTLSKRVGSGRILTEQIDTTLTPPLQNDTVLVSDAIIHTNHIQLIMTWNTLLLIEVRRNM